MSEHKNHSVNAEDDNALRKRVSSFGGITVSNL